MYQTVTIRIAASGHQRTAFQTMCLLVGGLRAIDEVPGHRAGALRALVRPRRLNDDTPVKTGSSARLEPAHACVLAPDGAGVIAVAGVSRAAPRRFARAGAGTCASWPQSRQVRVASVGMTDGSLRERPTARQLARPSEQYKGPISQNVLRGPMAGYAAGQRQEYDTADPTAEAFSAASHRTAEPTRCSRSARATSRNPTFRSRSE